MKKIVFLLFVFFGLLSCNNPVKKTTDLTFDKVEIDKKVFALNDSTKPYMKLNLSFTYPITGVNDTILSRIQKIFVEAFAGEEYLGRSPKGAFEALEKEYTEDALNLSSDLDGDLNWFGECYRNVSTDVIDTTKTIITVKTESSNYMGGAHGSYNVLYYLIDRENGNLLKEKDIFENYSEDAVSKLIKEALATKYGDSAKDILFDISDVKPNGNFYFNKDSIIYTYNEYEIAPYSSGTIEVAIPYSKLNNLNGAYIKKQDD